MRMSVVTALIVTCLPAASLAMDEHVAMQPDALKWAAAPPALPPGSEIAVLDGDPGSEGLFVVRVRMPANYKVPLHTHPTDENVTVIEGTLHISMGTADDPTRGEVVPTGGFFHMAKNVQHAAWATSPTIIQIHGMGPFAINYVNPEDDPRNAATTGTK